MVQNPDGKIPELEDDPELAAIEGEEEGDDEEGGDDQASLALNTPEPARAKMASMPVDKNQKGKAGKGKFKKDKLKDAKGVGVRLTDDALGLAEPGEEKPEAEDAQEQSAFDRDEITDAEVLYDITEDNIDPLAMLAGGQARPWENEKLSLMERMAMREGYDKNPDFDKDKADEANPKARGKKAQNPGAVKTAATAAIAVAMTAGAAAAASSGGKMPDGPTMAGVSRGPRREADQDRVQTGSDIARPSRTEQIRIEARENATDVTMRRFDKGLASSFAMQQAAQYNARQKAEERGPGLDELMDLIQDGPENDAGAPPQPGVINWSPAQDEDAQFRARMNELMLAIGLDNLSPVTPYREEMWSVKLMEYNENSADVTTAPEPPAPPAPLPDLSYRQEPKFNFGPGGPG